MKDRGIALLAAGFALALPASVFGGDVEFENVKEIRRADGRRVFTSTVKNNGRGTHPLNVTHDGVRYDAGRLPPGCVANVTVVSGPGSNPLIVVDRQTQECAPRRSSRRRC